MNTFKFDENLNENNSDNSLDGKIKFKTSLDGELLFNQPPITLNLENGKLPLENQLSAPTQASQDRSVESLEAPLSDANNIEWHGGHHSGGGGHDHPNDIDSAPTSYGSLQTLANYLRVGYWSDTGRTSRYYNIDNTGTGANYGVLYYNVSGYSGDSNGMSSARRTLVREAFKIYEEVLNINFVETTSTASHVDFFFKDNGSGANNVSYVYSGTGGPIDYSVINVNSGWSGGSSNIGGTSGYTFQTILHEIGHALGLGHQGDYNGSASFNSNAMWKNDSWQQSMMSYFDQSENPNITASYAQLITPMAVDWLALNQLYSWQGFGSTTFGTSQAFNGNTIWGVGTNISTTTSVAYNGLAGYADTNAFNIVDGSGIDTINFSNYSANQRIDLSIASSSSTKGTISDVGGKIGNMTIAVGTVIENATTGWGNDTLVGNSANNLLQGGSGNDSIVGNNSSSGGGYDTLVGGFGNDYLDSDIGSVNDTQGDSLDGGYGNDTLIGENGNDTLLGGSGNDSLRGDDNSSGANNDSLLGGSGDDTLRGEDGNDVLRGDSVNGENGDDSLDGGAGNDLIYGNGGADTLLGGSGNDNLDSDVLGQNDTIGDLLDGGAGNDNLQGEAGNDTMLGGTGNDYLDGNDGSSGGADNDSMLGGAGDDTLRGEAGNDVLRGDTSSGENGDDSLLGGDGNDLIYGNGGADSLFGGNGNDYLDSDALGQNDVVGDLLDGGAGDDNLQGEAGSDTLIGGTGNDYLDGNDGSSGGTDNDSLLGGAGDDTLRGEDGNDILRGDSTDGENGNDSLDGGAGNDFVYGNGGADSLFGGAGNDYVDSDVLGQNDTIGDLLDGGSGNDNLQGEAGDDTLIGGTGSDTMNGGLGNDMMIWNNGDGSDTMNGGSGDDIVQVFADTLSGDNFQLRANGVFVEMERVNLGNFTLDIDNVETIALNGEGGDDIFEVSDLSATDVNTVYFMAGSGNDSLNAINANVDITAFGGVGDDTLRGSNSASTTDNINGNTGNDVLYSSAGDDNLDGGHGHDSLFGSGGEDTLIGGTGNDFLDGGSGNDRMEGNLGNDTYRVNQLGDLVIEAVNQGIDHVYSSISFSLPSNVENLKLIGVLNRNGFGNSLANNIVGNVGNNFFVGQSGNDVIDGQSGNDYFFGNDGDDSLIGGDGNDVINGNADNDTLLGGNGNDRLNGQNGNDSLLGGNGDDIMIGGNGTDVLTGGAGNDSFRYDNRNQGVDTITDYNVADDRFVIRRAGFSNSLSFGVLNANQFTLGASASDANDRFIYNNATGALYFDRDGNGGLAQQQIATLSAGLALNNTEFVVV